MKRCDYLPNIYVSPVYSSAQYADPSNLTSFTAYSIDTTHASYNNDGSPMCPYQPYVKGWSPTCTNAGSFEEMTIWGTHFGSDTGKVFFTYATNPSLFIHTLPQDIRLWQDDTIRLLIPSDATAGVAGSGKFYIQAANLSDNSADSLQIPIGYANRNIRNPSPLNQDYMKEEFVYLRDSPYIFQLDSFFFYTPGAKTTIRDVISNINCLTGVNFQVDTTAPSIVRYPNHYDNVNLISLQTFNPSLFTSRQTLAYTDVNGVTNCYHGIAKYNNYAYSLNEIDISVIDTPYSGSWTWPISYSSSYPSLVYFSSVIAHELGHAAQLYHTQPQDGFNVMYPIINPGNNFYAYDSDPDDILGIRNVLQLGSLLGVNSCLLAASPVFFPGCPSPISPSCVSRVPIINGINGINQIDALVTFNAVLYPNPYEENTIIHIDISEHRDFTITISDLMGKILTQKVISSDTSLDISLSGFSQSAGLYLIQISDSNSSKIFKMIKY